MKQTVRSAARHLFAEQGFASTGVRQIAAEAGVDPANVIRYFGSKEGLFLETMDVPAEFGSILEGPLESLAEDYLRFVISGGPSVVGGQTLAALIRASDRPEVGTVLRDLTQSLFADRLAPRLGGADALLRAHLFAAGMTGIQVALWVSDDPVLAGSDIERVITAYAPSLQLLITP